MMHKELCASPAIVCQFLVNGVGEGELDKKVTE